MGILFIDDPGGGHYLPRLVKRPAKRGDEVGGDQVNNIVGRWCLWRLQRIER